tara:strand:+ start:111 stop:305 length:195 start_codon:yes stop_codon:yes gene_type:complete
VSIAKKNTNAPTIGQASLVSAQSYAATRAVRLRGLSTHALAVMISLWRYLTTAQIGVFVVANAF